MRYSLLFICCLFTTVLLSQEQLIGRVVDAKDQKPLAGAHVLTLEQPPLGVFTDEEGQFKFAVRKSTFQIVVSYLGYERDTIAIDPEMREVKIALERSATALEEVVVRATARPDTVYEEIRSVTQYEFLGDYLLLLTYKNSREKYSLVLLNEEEEIVDELSLRDREGVSRLHVDCMGSCWLLTRYYSYQVKIDEEGIHLGERAWMEDFGDPDEDCKLANENFVYFRQYYYYGQAMQYHAVERYSIEQVYALPMIVNTANTIRLLETLGVRLPYSGDLFDERASGAIQYIRGQRSEGTGGFEVFYPRLYAPLFSKAHQLILFNHFASEIHYYSQEGILQRIVPIFYPKNRKWRKEILYDEREEQAYTFFKNKKGLAIYQINLETGQTIEGQQIPMTYIEQLKVHRGHLYFLYRDRHGQGWNRLLHKIRLEEFLE